MRGKGTVLSEMITSQRITPAYAGKSDRGHGGQSRPRDHPRVCGEKITISAKSRKNSGSPPRMRGKGTDTWYHLSFLRITPAYAGKSPEHVRASRHEKDHPRVCGEKIALADLPDEFPGSPPRMRGKEFFDKSRSNCIRITPAYAGKSPSQAVGYAETWDHPRVCGEKTKKIP